MAAIVRPRERFDVFKRDGFRCAYCGRSATNGAILQLDHVVPRVLGGTNDPSNLVTSCSRCNLGKSGRPLDSPEQLPRLMPRRTEHETIPLGKVPDWMAWCASYCPDCPPQHVVEGCYTVLPLIYVDHDPEYRRFALGYRCGCGHLWLGWWDARRARDHANNVRELIAEYDAPHFPAQPQW